MEDATSLVSRRTDPAEEVVLLGILQLVEGEVGRQEGVVGLELREAGHAEQVIPKEGILRVPPFRRKPRRGPRGSQLVPGPVVGPGVEVAGGAGLPVTSRLHVPKQ